MNIFHKSSQTQKQPNVRGWEENHLKITSSRQSRVLVLEHVCMWDAAAVLSNDEMVN
ncbi:hypothetical protein J6590_073062 [Homalodisca vitripennis]|nr:hypothetical protein J6590_073062 [Homalodisca vitripennis]